MVKDISDDYCFSSNWKDTVEGAFHKYPNSANTNMASVDILARQLDSDGNLVTKKLIRSRFAPSQMMQKIMSIIGMPARDFQTSLECSRLDVAKRHYSMRALNKTYFNKISCYEVLEYMPHPDKPEETLLSQQAVIDMYVSDHNFTYRWALKAGEGLFANAYLSNSQKGRIGLEGVIQRLALEAKHDLEERLAKVPAGAEEFAKQCFTTGAECAKDVQNFTEKCLADTHKTLTGK